MRLLLVTPLFPPDTALSARYSKELAQHLSDYSVTVLLYGKLPELVDGVTFICVSKRRSPIIRLLTMTKNLVKNLTETDVLLLQNGPSVELPVFLVSLFYRKPIIFIESDKPAAKRSQGNWIQNKIYTAIQSKAIKNLTPDNTLWPISKPMLHPLKTRPEAELKKYETSWKAHTEVISKVIESTS